MYWQIINKSADDHTRQEVKKISMQIFVEHFKKLNTNDSKSDEGDVTDNTNIDNLNVELSKPFEPDEVKKSIILSNVFKSEIGVRQGDNLSPLLFSIYLSDLESFLSSNMMQYINLHRLNLLGNQKQNVCLNINCHINIKIKLMILIYSLTICYETVSMTRILLMQ